MQENIIYNEDCLQGMRKMDSESIDAIISDPPYGISFMGKDWDTFNELHNPSRSMKEKGFKKLPRNKPTAMREFFIPIMKECIRILKSGAFALWMMTPRQDSQAEFINCLKEAGFSIGFTPIYWTYASGFPKAGNVSKLVDKRFGAKREGIIKEGAGSKGNTFPLDSTYEDGAPVTSAAALNGSYCGFQPKPAVEVIIVSMKPLSEKTYVEQALKNGKGITWLDDCRIPYITEDTPKGGYGRMGIGIGKPAEHQQYTPMPHGNLNSSSENKWGYKELVDIGSSKGRFPANLLVSDNVLDNGKKQSIGHNPNIKVIGYGSFGGGTSKRVDWKEDTYIKDEGDFSRYFSLDEWWHVNFEELPKEQQKTFPFLIVPKANTGERNEGVDGAEKEVVKSNKRYSQLFKQEVETIVVKKEQGRGNIHATVKPIALMSYLITLATRENDIVLDPFIGSGTTAIASYMLKRKFIGFEREKEYYDIAQKRIAEAQAQARMDMD